MGKISKRLRFIRLIMHLGTPNHFLILGPQICQKEFSAVNKEEHHTHVLVCECVYIVRVC